MRKLTVPIILLIFFSCIGFASAQTVVVNEWMAKNSTSLQDEDGDYSDWVEIYNSGVSSVNLEGFGLSDDEYDAFKWVFPAVTLQSNEFLLVFCSGKNRTSGPVYHTNFRLGGSDEIIITNSSGLIVDSKDVGTTVFDISEGSVIDGSSTLTEFYGSTPGGSNTNGALHNKLKFSHQSGFYTESFNLVVNGSEPHQLRFTLDGSVPTMSDPVWNGTMLIEDPSNQTNSISTIPTNAPTLGDGIRWEEPSGNIAKGTVLRFRSFESGQPSSHTYSHSYFVNPQGSNRYSLPVVSLITDSLNLFDYDSGIYIPGVTHDLNPGGGGVWGTGNYKESGDAWERTAYFELLDASGQFEFGQDIGIRIHGTGSSSMPQKSLRLYAREKYGNEDFEHPFFSGLDEDEFDVLLLRNMGQDFKNGVAQDVLAHELIKDLNQASLANRAAIVFINGEYWGIQNLRERFDKHFLAQFHDLNKDSIDIIDNYYGSVEMGDEVVYDQLYDFIETNDLSIETNYNLVASQVEIDDFIDNTLTRIYLGCYDWPGNNMKMWRPREPNGKFRWLLLDNDVCIGNYAHNGIAHATEPNSSGWPNPPESTLFLRKLLENDGFKEQFISRMAELLNTEFDKDAAGVKLTALYNTYSPEYPEHDERWLMLEGSETLQENYENVLNALRLRPCYVREHFIEYFNLVESEFPFECDSSALSLGIDNALSQTRITIYPNPNSGSFNIKLPANYLGDATVQIYDLTGRRVYSETDLNTQSGEMAISISELTSGVYTLSVSSSTKTYTDKLVFQPN